jgi:hypothetical protein
MSKKDEVTMCDMLGVSTQGLLRASAPGMNTAVRSRFARRSIICRIHHLVHEAREGDRSRDMARLANITML